MWLITLLNRQVNYRYTHCITVREDHFHQFVQRPRVIKITIFFSPAFNKKRTKQNQKPAKNILQLDIQIYKCTFNKYTIWIYVEMWYGCHEGLFGCTDPRLCVYDLLKQGHSVGGVSEVKCCRWDTVGWCRCTSWNHERNLFSLQMSNGGRGSTSLLKWPVTH